MTIKLLLLQDSSGIVGGTTEEGGADKGIFVIRLRFLNNRAR